MDETAKLFLESWKDDYLIRNIMPNTPIDEQQSFWAAALKDDFPKPGHKFFKITDHRDGQLVCSKIPSSQLSKLLSIQRENKSDYHIIAKW
jgi:hypothetical protein